MYGVVLKLFHSGYKLANEYIQLLGIKYGIQLDTEPQSQNYIDSYTHYYLSQKTISCPLKAVSTISKQTALPCMHIRPCGWSCHCSENYPLSLQTHVIH